MPALDDTLTWKGAWAVGVDYVEDDAVLDGPNLVYVCILANTSALANRPPDATNWELLVDSPAADAYASVALYRSMIDKSDTSEDSVIADDLLAMSRLIDKKLGGRFFGQDSGTSRIYVGDGRVRLYTDDLVSITMLEIDSGLNGNYDTMLAASDYDLWPLNAGVGAEPKAYRGVELRSWGTQGSWASGTRVRITGTWGWPAIPPAIARATVELTAIVRLESDRATRTITELGQVAGMSAQGANIIDELVNHYSRVKR